EAIGQAQPARNAAVVRGLTVVIDQARAPFAPQRRIIAARNEARIFQRNRGLIVVAVERPGLHLAPGAFAAMQQAMERVQAMIALGPDVAQRCFELVGSHEPHSTISIPSSATAQPAASTRRRSGESSTRIGLVLLMCR